MQRKFQDDNEQKISNLFVFQGNRQPLLGIENNANNTANCSFEQYHNKWMKKLEPPIGIKPNASQLLVEHPNH